jgi:hypothetical protein
MAVNQPGYNPQQTQAPAAAGGTVILPSDVAIARGEKPTTKFNTPSQSNLVSRFISQVKHQGTYRSNRFVVLVHGPSVSANFFSPDNSIPGNLPDQNPVPKTADKLKFLNFNTPLTLNMKERLALACQEAILPAKGLMTQEFNSTGSGPPISHAYAENYAPEFTLSFLCSGDFFERQYFLNWMEGIVNRGTHEVALYEKYALPWSVIVACLPSDMGWLGSTQANEGASFGEIARGLGSDSTPAEFYYTKFEHVYPVRVNQSVLNHETDGSPIMKFDVMFKCYRWSDPIVQYRYRNTFEEYEIPEDKLSPFERFVRTAQKVAQYAKYADPRELRGLIINEGLGKLNSTFGEGTVETIAVGGQQADVFVRSDNIIKTGIQNPGSYLDSLIGR